METCSIVCLFVGKIGNISHPGHVEIFISHRNFAKLFYHTECCTCFNITLCNRPLIYQFFVEALVKYTYFVFGAVILTHFVLFTIYFLGSQRITHFVSQLFMYHTQCPLQSVSFLVVPLTRIWQFRVFSPVSTHLGPITPTPVVHFIISHAATTPTTPCTSDPSHPINWHASA